MAITGSGSTFWPLYWVHNDCWKYYKETQYDDAPSVVTEYDHAGHVHLFLMGWDWKNPTQDAWSGSQAYNFAMQDLWGPRSEDPNQQHQYTVVGTPKWYFRIEELWRRVYIQPWDARVETTLPELKRGVKYDCCASDKRFGPFREGRDYQSHTNFAPAYLQYARTMPIDYYLNDDLSQVNTVNYNITGTTNAWLADMSPSGGDVMGPFEDKVAAEAAASLWLANNAHDAPTQNRTNHIYDLAPALLQNGTGDTNPPYDISTFDPSAYDLQHDNYIYAGGNVPGVTPSPAAKPFSDLLYAWPIIEYQNVIKLDWERLPENAGNEDGDGWSVKVELPLKDHVTGIPDTPFCPHGTRAVMPIGSYYNNFVTSDSKPGYPTVSYDDPEHPPEHPFYYDTPEKLNPNLSGQKITFNNPYGDKLDGRWVQQFLGGIVHAKALVTIQSKLGGTQEVWVNTTQYIPNDAFSGTDQGRPAGGI